MRELFDRLDEDGSGEITTVELRRGLVRLTDEAEGTSSKRAELLEKRKQNSRTGGAASATAAAVSAPFGKLRRSDTGGDGGGVGGFGGLGGGKGGGGGGGGGLDSLAERARREQEVALRLDAAEQQAAEAGAGRGLGVEEASPAGEGPSPCGTVAALEKLDGAMHDKGLSWEAVDRDGDGSTDADELMGSLREAGLGGVLRKEEGRAVVDFFDANGDGVVERVEFEDVLRLVRRRRTRRRTQARRDKRREDSEQRSQRRLSKFATDTDF